jgi:hypothetical protein
MEDGGIEEEEEEEKETHGRRVFCVYDLLRSKKKK